MNLQIMGPTERAAGMRSARSRRKTQFARSAPTIITSRLARKALAITLSSNQLKMPTSKLNVGLIRGLLLNVLGHYTILPSYIDVETFTPADDLIIYKIKCSTNDYPKINGKLGVSFKALRTVFSAIGQASGARIELNLAEKPNSFCLHDTFGHLAFDPTTIQQTLEAIMATLCGEAVAVQVSNSQDVTAYTITLPTPISDQVKDALHRLIELMGAKERHNLYLVFA